MMTIILSIDWDYFIDVTAIERFMYFPDGGNENIMGELSDFVWAGQYSDCKNGGFDIEHIKVRESEKKTLLSAKYSRFAYLYADSHRYLGNYVLDNTEAEDDILIINIDFHSDLYDNKDQNINCGNWAYHVLKKRENAKIIWVANPDSETDADELQEYVKSGQLEITTDLEWTLKEFSHKSDVIYLCRSSIWSPPHLDKDFQKLHRFFNKRCRVNMVQQTDIITPDRWKAVKESVKLNDVARHLGNEEFKHT